MKMHQCSVLLPAKRWQPFFVCPQRYPAAGPIHLLAGLFNSAHPPFNTIATYAHCANQYKPVLTRYARLIIYQEPAASRIAQTVLELIWEERTKLPTVDTIRAFITRTTQELCQQWLQQKTGLCNTSSRIQALLFN